MISFFGLFKAFHSGKLLYNDSSLFIAPCYGSIRFKLLTGNWYGGIVVDFEVFYLFILDSVSKISFC